MKKMIYRLVVLALAAVFPASLVSIWGQSAAPAPELGTAGLKGLQYVVPVLVMNSIPCGETYKDKNEEETQPFQLKEAAEKAQKAGCPLKKEDLAAIYADMNERLAKAALNPLKMRQYPGATDNSAVIPSLLLYIDTLPTGEKPSKLAVSLHMVLSKHISIWMDAGRVNTPVYAWSAKKLAVIDGQNVQAGLTPLITELMDRFTGDRQSANPAQNPQAGEKTDGGQSKPADKEKKKK